MAKAMLLIDLSPEAVEALLEDLKDKTMSQKETIFEMVCDEVRDGTFVFRIVSDPLPGMEIIFEYGKVAYEGR
jgi:hypothetical protein